MIKKSLLLTLSLMTGVLLRAQTFATVSDCIAEGNALFARQDVHQSLAVYEKCYAMDKKNEDVILSLAGLHLSSENLAEAKKYFNLAAKGMKKNSPYIAYTYSRLGDIYFRENDYDEALKNYDKSLSYNSGNVNSIIGRAIILERRGEIAGAAQAYKTALMVEPYNIIARDNSRRLEPYIMSSSEILEALKERSAVSEDVQILTEPLRTLFMQIHRAEQSQGIEYLTKRYKNNVPRGFIVEKNAGRPDIRLMLSLNGYKAFMMLFSMDAAKYFQAAGVNAYDVYALRNLYGEPVFDDKKVLTEEGITVYNAALAGTKEYLLPKEPLPADNREFLAMVEAIKAKGFDVELANKEYAYLIKSSKCPEKTLLENNLAAVAVHKRNYRAFIQTPEDSAIPDAKLYVYNIIMDYREYGELAGAKASSNFFGTGGSVESPTLCDKKGNLTIGVAGFKPLQK
ncbi:tetratricopeptide (TPR) repeat protein [Elusimicrobium posterum]|uniref:tetratricopeptide repeat protein n=1 Tax=Elusimicrobium posterum TaxID=3116653 RepID=UPI003C75D82B